MISKAQITYILTLNESKNFQRAADKCFVTQPTLSMQIKKAETALGAMIFDRDTSPLSLTSFGKHILPFIEKIDSDYQSLKDEIDKNKGTYKAQVRLGIIPTIAGYLVPDLYEQWQAELGEIQLDIIELKTTDLIKALENKEIDLGIMAGPLDNKIIQQQRLFDEEIFVYSPEIDQEIITQVELQDLKPWLLSEGNCLRTQMINFCNLKSNTKDDWQYQGGSMNILLKMVELQGGYTLVPSNYMPYLSLKHNDFKKMKDLIPIRQIIGAHLSRNSKKEHIVRLMRLIQRNKSDNNLHQVKTEILPWS
jgi:LysR family hydrogen peroxide-inducible transcriptional activator